MSHRKLYKAIRALAIMLEKEWGTRPFIMLSCVGGADEHIQFYHPHHLHMPAYIIDPEGEVRIHPDSPLMNTENKEH